MLHNFSELPQTVVLAIDRHKRLLDETQQYRLQMVACASNNASNNASNVERPLRWRRLRLRVGELLIHLGQRLGAEAKATSKPVWG